MHLRMKIQSPQLTKRFRMSEVSLDIHKAHLQGNINQLTYGDEMICIENLGG